MTSCPHCKAELPDVCDAYCPECRNELPAAPVEPGTARKPITATKVGWMFVVVVQGVFTLIFFAAVLVWMVLSLVERLEAK